jgi:two-component system cell cycle sensor histidine kinase/response regulator CckA
MPFKHHATEDGASSAGPDGVETILIVDDEPMVLQLCCSILTREGYVVLRAGSAKEALDICRGSDRKLHLLLSDIVMPKLRGTELAALVSKMRPEIRVLLMSGFDGGEIPEYESLSLSSQLIPKPFTPSELVQAVRSALEKSTGL